VETTYPPTSIKVKGTTVGTQSDSFKDFSLEELKVSSGHKKTSIFSGDVGEPVRVPWHESVFQVGKTFDSIPQVRLDSNPQMINPKSWAKSAFMTSLPAKTKNTVFNLGPDLKDSLDFELRKPTFVPPSVCKIL
jgi:hypothetical protein